VTDETRGDGFVSEHQRRVVEAKGDFFLIACPGSGKTRAGGVRFARLAQEGRRVAATSYTNIGVDQIRSIVIGVLGLSIPSTCFVGTLHAFLLSYVFYPFGHLVMGCPGRPRVIRDGAAWPEVVLGNNHIRAPLANFRFRPDGSLCYRGDKPHGMASREAAAAVGQVQAKSLKLRWARLGLASPDDSMFWAYQALRDYPFIREALGTRFQELQVDEAQDTSELQLACLHELSATGRLKSLVLIGDIEQSIYSFQGASPQGCLALANGRGLETMELTENYRSSQRICDVTVHFCARAQPDRAVGTTAACPWQPELFLYDSKKPQAAVAWFAKRLQDLNIDLSDAAVLARANTLVAELNGEDGSVKCDPRPLALGRATAAVRGRSTLSRRQMEAVELVLAYTAFDVTDLGQLDGPERDAVRRASIALLKSLPSLDSDMRQWVRGAAAAVDGQTAQLVKIPAHTAAHAIRSNRDQTGIVAASIFTTPTGLLRAQTVHDVKGESRDAVLVVADYARSRIRDAQGVLWGRPLIGETVADEEVEEIRIVFVALTRARRFCALAVPSDTNPRVINGFQSKGFVRIQPT
jgi:ATP-dependent DNA helicase UvrD/PcrA